MGTFNKRGDKERFYFENGDKAPNNTTGIGTHVWHRTETSDFMRFVEETFYRETEKAVFRIDETYAHKQNHGTQWHRTKAEAVQFNLSECGNCIGILEARIVRLKAERIKLREMLEDYKNGH